ncbi:MAG: phosphate acetyltransferase [Bergeyella sp.]
MKPHTARTLFLAPCGSEAGLTTLALGMVRALDARGVRVAFFKPIGQPQAHDIGPERSTHFIRSTTSLRPAAPIPQAEAAQLLANGGIDQLLDRVITNFHASFEEADVVVVEGMVHTHEWPFAGMLNIQMAKALGAHVILAGALKQGNLEDYESHLELAIRDFGGKEGGNLLGCIINLVPESLAKPLEDIRAELIRSSAFFSRTGFPIIGAIPDNPELRASRTIDIARHLGATVLNAGEMNTRRVKKFSVLARTVPNMLHAFSPGALLLTPSDRADVILAVAMASMGQVAMAGMILTGDSETAPGILELCRPAMETGLPILKANTNSWHTATTLDRMSLEVPSDDIERVQLSMDYVASFIDADWLATQAAAPTEVRLSPAAFCYRLTELARQAKKRIVLPEGDEPRTLRAASICASRGIARCVLLGNPEDIRRVAKGHEIELPPEIEIIDPAVVRHRYIEPLCEMRKHKGLTPKSAADYLEDTVWLGTMMLALGEVDGLVSGAVHSTANTIRPSLLVIKTKPEAKAVSSIFFMCLPDQVVVYGDCAVNPDPDAELLADIAIQSADSAESFGIPARVAMISYSTGESGSGQDVEKVREATRIAKQKRPDLLIDGPLQYDAASTVDVATTKAPGSPVAGRATVFVFPDLNTGNTTYKAVQRSANVISIGPMLQGLKRPVNDLSRGALVEDIVYTIALTAIQANEG